MVCYIRRRFTGAHPVKLQARLPFDRWKKIHPSEILHLRQRRRRRQSYTKWSRAWTNVYIELCGKNVFA
ncbi:MAG TPA: hypothetical protein DCZ95_16505 [Verrucomicrobia bacterium]|nr:MAG: hypothetical protein A2X46_15655 [Lentisphaerae bacterium GWF2_57_35]HBA85684.1 hypothetical protein [Verrucomicrobiota bacterium]